MDSAKRYILENDPHDFLPLINGIRLYMKCGITLFVDNLGENYKDMTLTQFAIANRKDESLKKLLRMSYFSFQIEFNKIIYPDTSNTKSDLLNLAIEFGSKNPQLKYESDDTKCLEVILDFIKETKEDFNIDKENNNGETLLIRAISFQNVQACQLLLQNGSDIFYKSQNPNFSLTPLLYLCKHAKSLTILQNLLNKDSLGDEVFSKYLDHLKTEEFDNFIKKDCIENKSTQEFFKLNLIERKPFYKGCLKCKKTEELEKCTVCNNFFCKNCIKNHGCVEKNQEQPEMKIESNGCKCSKCRTELSKDERMLCEMCKKFYCEDCIDDHGC